MIAPRPPDLPADRFPRRWPVRLILFGIVFALVLPGLMFCGILLQRIATAEHARSLEQAQAAALRTAEMLDRELSNIAASLFALSTSPAIDSADMPALQLQIVALSQSIGENVVYADADGLQLLASGTPVGTPLRRMAATDTVHDALRTRALAVSGLFNSNEGKPALAIVVPVVRQNAANTVLAIRIDPASISSLLQKQGLPPGWIISITGADDRVLARSQDGGRYLGQLATDDFRAHAVGNHAIWTGKTLDGITVLAAMQRQRLADWRVGVGVPLSTIEAPLRSTVTLLIITGGVTMLIACVLAWKLAQSVAVPLQRLALAGAALGQGLPVLGVRSSIAEVHAVSRALVQATRDLHARAAALAAEQAQLAALIETVPVGLVLAEAPSGRVTAGNRYLEHMLRHPLRRSTSGAHYNEWICHHADGSRVQAHEFPMYRVLNGAPHAELQCIYQRGDGSHFWIQAVAAPVRGPDGTMTGGVVAILDIDEAVRAREAKARFAEHLEAQVIERTTALEATNQRLRDEMEARAAAEEQLRQAQKMEAVGQLTGGIAHDFNNLLTIIMGSLDLLRRRATEDRNRRLVDNAMDGATRAATLTARLLAFSRRQPLTPQAIDVNRLVSGMSDLLYRTLSEDVRVETVLAGGLWQTHADPNQLENALLNLAVNARDAMLDLASGGTSSRLLTIETGNTVLDDAFAAQNIDVQPGEYVSIDVTDTGAGMPADVLARVFEPFYTTKPQGQGTGLGLSQVHGFVKQSGGHVSIRTSPHQGTTVTIHLPRFHAAEDSPAAPQTPPGMAPRPVATLTILAVEDEEAVRRFTVSALKELGHVVLEADQAASALRLLDAHPEIGLLFTDVMLPQMNGVRLAEEALRRRPGLPVLFTSGFAGDEPGEKSPLPPGAVLLRKPFTVEGLGEKIASVAATTNNPL